jgi:sarcosine oxidase subunit beta
VAVHDPRGIGTGSTSKAAGILSTMVSNDEDARLVQETAKGLLALQRRTGHPVFVPHSSCIVAGEGQGATLQAYAARAKRLGVGHRIVDHEDALHLHDGEQLLWVEGDGCIEAGDLVALLQDQAAEAGARLRARHDKPQLTVVAAGAWTEPILEQEGARLPLIPYRAQLASLRMTDGDHLPIVHDLRQGFYLRPGGHGEFLAGDGTQLRRFHPDDYNEAGEPEFLESIAHRVIERVKGGDTAGIKASWAGLCVATPDRRPLVGPVPGKPGLFVMAGDNGFGVMRCVALGERLADAVEGRVDGGLDPARFGSSPAKEFELREGFAP